MQRYTNNCKTQTLTLISIIKVTQSVILDNRLEHLFILIASKGSEIFEVGNFRGII